MCWPAALCARLEREDERERPAAGYPRPVCCVYGAGRRGVGKQEQYKDGQVIMVLGGQWPPWPWPPCEAATAI